MSRETSSLGMAVKPSGGGHRLFVEFGEQARAHGTSDLVNHIELIFEREAARTWEANTPVEQVLRHLSSVSLASGVKRLEVHGFPDRAGLDVGGIQDVDQLDRKSTRLNSS